MISKTIKDRPAHNNDNRRKVMRRCTKCGTRTAIVAERKPRGVKDGRLFC